MILNHAIKTTVCKIYFNMRLEPFFYRENQILNSLQTLVKFVLKTNSMPNMAE